MTRTPEERVIASALALSEVLLESLKHPTHAAILDPLRTKAEAILKRFFRRERAKVLRKLSAGLRKLASERKEASADDKAKAKAIVPDDLLPLSVNAGIAYDYGRVLTSTVSAAYEQLAEELAADATIGEDVMEEYLRNNGLRKLTGNLAQTTVDRLRDAIADAYAEGKSYNGLVDAIKATYEGFSDVRAGMIAQTELNNAYNWGRKLLGLDLRMTEKAWSCDGPDPCDVCLGNQGEGWIGINETFASGDAMPTAHPMCYCSLSLRKGGE